ncbi:MAG TPA: universal stress protein [Candidatus Sumerlaeota bacterium]|nr:universal stress protein [Candidatus Sumerlaeota bacterium]HOR27912.1 universal stress protein [Candidatus Sumerlaeota bacterium]HPK00985.1 universal stress protein [Candidatus Sumerlaeota bacterium]
MKSVFVAYDGSPSAEAALRYACHLASLFEGKIYAGYVVELTNDPAVTTGMMTASMEYLAAMPPSRSPEEIEAERQERLAHAQRLFERVQAICQEWPVPFETMVRTGYAEEEILARGAMVDLLAIGKGSPEPEDPERRRLSRLARAIVRSAPQPVLVAAEAYHPPRDIIILDNGDERALHALAFGARLAGLAGLPLRIVTAAHDDADAQWINERARRYLADHQLEFTFDAIPARFEPADEIIQHLAQYPDALVLMGAFGDSRVKTLIAGSTTCAIMKALAHPILFFRY